MKKFNIKISGNKKLKSKRSNLISFMHKVKFNAIKR